MHQAQAPWADATEPAGISVLGSVKPPAPQLPQPGHFHPAGATLPHEGGGKAFLVDIYGVTSLPRVLRGEGWFICAVAQVHPSWALQSDDDRELCATKRFPPTLA